MKGDCPTRGTRTVVPSTNAVPDVQGNTTLDNNERKLLKAWGSVNGRRVLILFDPGSTDNFISVQVADDLQLQPNQLGLPLQTTSAFEGSGTNSTPIIGKLDLVIEKYKDQESFLLAPIEGCDVILGMPWHFKAHPTLDYVKKTGFQSQGEEIFYTC